MTDDIERKYIELIREHELLKEAADMLRKGRDALLEQLRLANIDLFNLYAEQARKS